MDPQPAPDDFANAPRFGGYFTPEVLDHVTHALLIPLWIAYAERPEPRRAEP